MNILTVIYNFLDLILSNFNIAWLLLIFMLMFRKKILDLFTRVGKIGYKDGYINFEVEGVSKHLDEAVKNYSEEDKVLLGAGGGGGPNEMSEEDIRHMETLKMIADDNELIQHYSVHGDRETIIRMFRWFENTLIKGYALDFTDRPQANKKLESVDKELHSIFQELQKIYFITLENNSTDRLWKINDVLNYSSLIKIGLNKMK